MIIIENEIPNKYLLLFSFRYQALAISSGVDHGSNPNNDVRRKGGENDSLSVSQSSKKVLPEWSFNIGECALGIQTTQKLRNTPQTILVLGERNFFALNDNGQLIFMSKFEYNPSSFILYNNDNKLDGKLDSLHICIEWFVYLIRFNKFWWCSIYYWYTFSYIIYCSRCSYTLGSTYRCYTCTNWCLYNSVSF